MGISYIDTAKTVLYDLTYFPKGLANSVDTEDKFFKFVLSVFSCNYTVSRDFKSTVELFETFSVINILTPMLEANGKFWKESNVKITSKIVLLGAALINGAKGLDRLQLVPLTVYGKVIENLPVLALAAPLMPPLNIAKDALVFVSTGFSFYANWIEGSDLKAKFVATDLKMHSKIHGNRIALIADVSKAAIVGSVLAVSLSGVGFGAVVATTSYGVIKVGMVVQSIGMISSTFALIKSCHTIASS